MVEALCSFLSKLYSFLVEYISIFLGLGKNRLYFEKSGLSLVFEDNQDGHSVLGEGAFSTVFVATAANSISAQKYAVKRINLQSDEFERSFKMELTAYQRFKHKNIVSMVDSMTVPATSSSFKVGYLLFPLMERGSLRDFLNRTVLAVGTKDEGIGSVASGRHSSTAYLKRVLTDFLGIAEAFNVMHTFEPHAYVHQDIKPENVLITNNGTPLLCDFGSVRLANVTIDSRQMALKVADEAAQFCTVSYRAPELFDPPRGSTLDTRTDVWGIGCLLFAWWFGYSPYESEFSDTDGSIRVVDCSHNRVLSKMPRKPPTFCTGNDIIIMNLVENILEHDFSKRCYTSDILRAIEEKLHNLFPRGGLEMDAV
jgi:serine/threonine kinase 16